MTTDSLIIINRLPGPNAVTLGNAIDNKDGTSTSWKLPLPPFDPKTDVEPVNANIDPGILLIIIMFIVMVMIMVILCLRARKQSSSSCI